MKRLTFADPALQDLRVIHDYIAKDNADAALDFIERLQERCNKLVSFPDMGRKRDELKRGYKSITEGEYVIFYRMLNDQELAVMRVIHAKRDLGKIVFTE